MVTYFNFFSDFLEDKKVIIVVIVSTNVTDVSLYLVLSFLKIIMIVRITTIVVEYRKWNRKRLVERVLKERKEDMNKEKDKEKKKKKGGVANPKSQKYKDTNIQTIPTNGRDKELKEQDSFAIKPLNMSKISGDKGLNIFNEFKKQTKLESHVTLLTIKRTMT